MATKGGWQISLERITTKECAGNVQKEMVVFTIYGHPAERQASSVKRYMWKLKKKKNAEDKICCET